MRSEQLARRQVDVPVLQRLIDLVDADLLRPQLVGIHLHAHRVLLRAVHLHLRHAADHRDARREDRLRVVVQHRHREAARRQAQLHDVLIGRVLLAERRRIRHARRQQRHDGRQGGLHVDDGAVHRAREVELQRDVAAAVAALRGHRIDAGNRRQLPLDRAGDGGRHRSRIAARQARLNLYGRRVHRRQIADGKRLVGDDAEQRDRQHQEAGGDRTPDEDLEMFTGRGALAPVPWPPRPSLPPRAPPAPPPD